jgi:hypothetical protein
MFDINKHMEKYPGVAFRVIPKLVCVNGFEVSVQASEFHYCKPRSNQGPYLSFEVGYPSLLDELLNPYDDGDGAIFPQVPASVVNVLINKHGGLK